MSQFYTCKYCSGHCRFTLSNLTCENCGSEQDVPVFEDEWNVSERTCEYKDMYTNYISNDDNIAHSKHKDIDKQQAASRSLFMTIQDKTKLSDSTMDLAQTLLSTYQTDPKNHMIRGEQRRLEFCVACTYYATKSSLHGVMTLNRIIELVFINNFISLHWACKELLEFFANDKRFSDLFGGRDIHITEAITRISKNVSKNTDVPMKDIYKLAHKMVDKIKRKDEHFVTETSSERLAASLVFVGCKLLKKNIPLNTMVLLSGTNESNLLKLEKKIKSYIRG